MIIGNTNQPHPSLQLNDTQIDQVHSYQQLGVILNDKLNWEDHINHVISKANRKIGLMWKLSSELPRYAVENIYTSYIRPQLEYSAVIYNNCTREQSRRLEACQRKAAIACTRAYRRTNTENLLNELGWSKLEDRRTYCGQVMLYKITNGLTPNYLQELLPARQGQNTTYPSRRENSFIPIRANTTKYYTSFIPSVVRKWNTLDATLQTAPSLDTFKDRLKKSMFHKSVGYHSRCYGPAAVTHTRMRLGLSPLKHQLHSHRIIESPTCIQCHSGEEETTTHYLLRCTKHMTSRRDLLQGLGPTIDRLGIDIDNTTLITKLLLTGHPELTFNENVSLCKSVQNYINNTKRF